MKCELCQSNLNHQWRLRDFYDFSVYKQPFICEICYDNFQQIDPQTACLECQGVTVGKYCVDCQQWFKQGFRKYTMNHYSNMMHK